MKASKNCFDIIKKFEGCFITAYADVTGTPTIGYGHTKNVKLSDCITIEQADRFLYEDITRFEEHVNFINSKYEYNFSQEQFDALTSFAFNVGSIVGLTNNGWRSKLEIAESILLYDKAHVNGNKITLSGLTKRRQAEHDLFMRNTIVKSVPVFYISNTPYTHTGESETVEGIDYALMLNRKTNCIDKIAESVFYDMGVVFAEEK